MDFRQRNKVLFAGRNGLSPCCLAHRDRQ